MNVDMTTSIPAGANQSSSARSKAMVDYNSFLKLLIAQMKNQDPTQPMDSTQYVAQLATFSQVEQSMQANTKLDQILQASSLSQATSLIGHSISSLDGEVSGIVKEVRLFSDGMVAVLESGEQVLVGPGISITAPPAGDTDPATT
ncbi:flagellar hook assembly protein FlgD [Aquamicrobium sp. NLF2-7]|uniref:flagellar hook assembly protein FlgD n=1 Tax=Aquamicrobium sp. NLF2-7 TaxID=2918753 RepID=UPI001EFB2399|nr:flagellar hook assembly protein FlgD [Aquamicrobium sp. NLF2-7]MCG8271254.1 flagellar hook assembly protein FlgD [Aquamicrobium sp. NLF2-7]